MIADAERSSHLPSSGQFQSVPLAVIERQGVRFKTFLCANRQRGRRIKTAADQDDGAFHFSSGNSARTVRAIPPRAENSAVTTASRGEQARTKSSRMRFVTASLKARSLRYDAR